MEDSDFSDEFCRFIQTTIPSVAAAELLLLLAKDPGRWWDPKEIPGNLPPGSNVTEEETRKCLELFQARALLEVGPDQRVQYRPGSGNLAALVRALAQAYNERPVTLIRMIYALRDPRIKSFADAFRFFWKG
jgi:hypothetical protein